MAERRRGAKPAQKRSAQRRSAPKSGARRRRSWPPLLLPVLLALALAVPVLVLDRHNGLAALLALTREVAEARAHSEVLEQLRNALRSELFGLRSDPVAVEAAARRTLGMVRPGEVVVRLDSRD